MCCVSGVSVYKFCPDGLSLNIVPRSTMVNASNVIMVSEKISSSHYRCLIRHSPSLWKFSHSAHADMLLGHSASHDLISFWLPHVFRSVYFLRSQHNVMPCVSAREPSVDISLMQGLLTYAAHWIREKMEESVTSVLLCAVGICEVNSG